MLRPERIPARRTALAVVAVAICVAAAVGGLAFSDALQAAGPPPAPCNGSRLLCDRSLSDVALAATHNAMSAPLPGWYGAEQEAAIPAQLQDGVRGLLIDTYEAARLPSGRLRTVLDGPYAGGPLADVSPQARRAAERLRARLGFRGAGKRSLYLCHGFCELGGTALATVLGQIDDYLGLDRSGSARRQRGQGQRPGATAAAAARVPAAAWPSAEPRRRQLLPHGRRDEGGRRAQRRSRVRHAVTAGRAPGGEH